MAKPFDKIIIQEGDIPNGREFKKLLDAFNLMAEHLSYIEDRQITFDENMAVYFKEFTGKRSDFPIVFSKETTRKTKGVLLCQAYKKDDPNELFPDPVVPQWISDPGGIKIKDVNQLPDDGTYFMRFMYF